MLADQAPDAADAGADHHGDPFRVQASFVGLAGEARVRPRFPGGDDRRLLGPVQAPGLDSGQHLGRIDGHARGDAHLQVGGPVFGEGHDTRPPFEQAGPECRHVAPEGSSGAKAGDDDVVDHGGVLRGAGRRGFAVGVELSRSSGCR